MTATEKAVKQLRAYARYLDEHAENIIGDVDDPNYVAEGGIHISFDLMDRNAAPTVNVCKEHMVLEAFRVMHE